MSPGRMGMGGMPMMPAGMMSMPMPSAAAMAGGHGMPMAGPDGMPCQSQWAFRGRGAPRDATKASSRRSMACSGRLAAAEATAAAVVAAVAAAGVRVSRALLTD